jgi:SMI1-KNR4 cell-wall
VNDHALLDRLAALLPPPPDVEPPDWRKVERSWGTPLPPDYRAFRERWGTGALGDTVDVYDEAELREWVRDTVRDLLEDKEDERPIFPAPDGVLVWGSTESKWFLFWRTEGPPEDWRIALLDDLMRWVDTDLRFVEWLVAGLEGRLEAGKAPPELVAEDETELPPAGERGHRWFADDGDDDDRDQRPFDANSVLQALGMGEDDRGPEFSVDLDLGGVIDRPRGEALEAFLAWVAERDPALRDEVLKATARASREEIRLRSAPAVPGLARAASHFASEQLGVPHGDPEFLDHLFDEDWPPA